MKPGMNGELIKVERSRQRKMLNIEMVTQRQKRIVVNVKKCWGKMDEFTLREQKTAVLVITQFTVHMV
jgi:hypothetical protein